MDCTRAVLSTAVSNFINFSSKIITLIIEEYEIHLNELVNINAYCTC